ncbi:MAG: hypothetical protein CVU08_12795 [Bacteroidetes bacterium HGW-Bacteroidetes-3]|nr:MAG: hypothetical protein CVU08_12795 [Bacteroidetes bacterium HGW-Bacteroidetes-3]
MFKLSFYTSFILFLIVGVLYSCNKSPKEKDYKIFNSQHHNWKSLRVTQFVNDINYTATDVPLQYYLIKDIGEDYQNIDSIYNANVKERIIEVEFQHIDQIDLLLPEYTTKTYEEAVKYMAFAIEKDFAIVTSSNDTLKCSGVNFERNFKIAPFKRLLLYFNNINPNDHIQLIYQDHLFGNGIIKFKFKELPIKL